MFLLYKGKGPPYWAFSLLHSLSLDAHQNPSCGPTTHPAASSLPAPQQSQKRSRPLAPTTSSSQNSDPWPSLQNPMAFETSPPVKSAGWRRQAVFGLREGSKRCLQWRQVRQEGLGGEEEEEEEEEEELVGVGVEASMEDRSSDRGGQTRHRLSLCFRGEKEGRAAAVQGVASSREPATMQHIGAEGRC